ncbi:NAD(P)-binding domain-containing protein, partial [Aquimarina celericrescens]|nr:NAD(P)-binding domain-containing protein [Aquimarina celericrescens]
RSDALQYYRRIVTSNNLNINLFEKVENINKTEGLFTVISSIDTYTATNVILATGFYDIPNKINVPGEDLKKVSHYYNDPH